MTDRLVVLMTRAGSDPVRAFLEEALAFVRDGGQVRALFRDESLAFLCKRTTRERLGIVLPDDRRDEAPGPGLVAVGALKRGLHELATAGDVGLFVCTSSLFLWSLQRGDLSSALTGTRGLVAFLADDVIGASLVRTY